VQTCALPICVPAGAVQTHDDAFELPFAPGGEEGRPLQRTDPRADADRLQIAGERLAQGDEWRIWIEVAGIEPVRVAGLGQELLRPGWIVRRRIDGERELEAPRNDGARRPRETERLGLVHGRAIDREAGRLTDALVVPRRLR